MTPGSVQPANPTQAQPVNPMQAPPDIPTQIAPPVNPAQPASPYNPMQQAPPVIPTQPAQPYNPAPSPSYNPAPPMPGIDVQASTTQGVTVLSSWQVPADNPPMNNEPSSPDSGRRRYAWLWFLIPIITILAFVVYTLTKGSGDTEQGQTTPQDSVKTEQTEQPETNPIPKENTETREDGLSSKQETEDETNNNGNDVTEPLGNVAEPDPQPQEPAQQSRDQWQMLHQNGDVVRGEELLVGFPNQTEEQIINGLQDMVRRHMISLRQYDEAIEALERSKMQ